ncbi:MAG: elongation factor P [Candidatus Improbicoccus pseudotrichonymphae]|uniref:Elongation factor P n=1 Tax=Candidatus Improbicoccus pseudotrichonymphae TaxID=3033792 RepID=A0AA48I452_9FIRM|nr:MAG: elongation factor P [Candidatus Improbicoccus pseudotrichonymphae]
MISAGDFRNGTTFELNSQLVTVIEFQHVKPGKGSAFVRAKIKNVITGSVIERTFNPNEKFPDVFIEKKIAQYLYNDGNSYYFMDTKSFEQISVDKKKLDENFIFIKENVECKILIHKNDVLGVELPIFVELKVTETEPGIKGSTATNVTKPATLETGAQIKVPVFIDKDDIIKIDVRTGKYMERA